MPKYKIERWDGVIPKGQTFPQPMIYFKPDKAFIDYAKENKYTVMINISDTESPYDKDAFVGIIDSSGYYPEYRPNFYNDTGLFVITLQAEWAGYPPKNGNMLIRGLAGEDKLTPLPPPKFVAPKPIITELYQGSPPQEDKMDYKQLSYVLMFIFLIFGSLFALSLRK